MSIYVIGDIHGCINTLRALCEKIPSDAKIVFTGDLIDRGPNSRAVIDFVRSNNFDCVLGNHDLEFSKLEFIKSVDNFSIPYLSPEIYNSNWGIDSSLENYFYPYDIKNIYNRLPLKLEKYDKEQYLIDREFLCSLPIAKRYKVPGHMDLVVSHSFINEFHGEELESYTYFEIEEVLFRHVFKNGILLVEDKKRDFFNIFGHTAVYMEPTIMNNFALIDTGAVFGGKLTALKYPEMEIIQQELLDEKF